MKKESFRFGYSVLSFYFKTTPVTEADYCDVMKNRFHIEMFVCFVALHPKSTVMVMTGRSVHLTTPFSWANLNKRLNISLCTQFRFINR